MPSVFEGLRNLEIIRGQYINGSFSKQDRCEPRLGQLVQRKDGEDLGIEQMVTLTTWAHNNSGTGTLNIFQPRPLYNHFPGE